MNPPDNFTSQPRLVQFVPVIAVILLLVLAGRSNGQSTKPDRISPGAAPDVSPTPLTRDEAVRLALAQASNYQQAQFSESSAVEDVRQAQTAFLPKFISTPTLIYNSPSSGATVPHTPGFIGANAITEIQGLVGAVGELDLTGRLRATLRRNRALLAAAHAGTEAARRALIEATEESYYALALTAARRYASEQNLETAEKFEQITSLLASGGEVAEVDLIRARLQTTARRDELEQARASEAIAADSLRVLIGYDMTAPVKTVELLNNLPEGAELQNDTPNFATEAVQNTLARRPEFLQLEALRNAALQDVRLSRAERRPQFTYAINGGFAADSLRRSSLQQHSGVLATLSLTIPLFDWGASRSRERQAQLRVQTLESTQTLALRGFAQQFSSARTQALSAAARIRLLGASLDLARRNVEISIARYRAGEAQIIEVTDAQTTLSAQRAAYAQAIYDYRIALARLRQTTGQ